MSVIKAGTTLTTAYTVEADTTGALEFKTGPSATLAMSISSSGVVTFPAGAGFDLSSANITNLTSSTATISNTLALSGGTANGMLYLNGSSVVTSSSAVVFDGTAIGIGVNPNTWSSGTGILQYGNKGSLISNNSVASYGFNSYYDGADKYITNGPAADHLTDGNNHYFRSAASGTPNAALSWTTILAVGRGTSVALEGASSQSGTGITFPATQSASSNANTLDDYEEGTWTPTFSGESTAGTTTYVVQRGGYIKIGAMVTVWCDLALSAATGTGNVLIGGLPFSSIGDVNFQSVAPLMVDSVDWGAGTYLQAYLYASTNVRIYYMADNASWAQQQVNNESQEYIFTMNYRVA